MIAIDCAGLTQPRQLHQRIAQALQFPDWYGNNLDALFDLLAETEASIHLLHFDSQTFPGFGQAFTDAMAENPNLQIFFD